MTVEETFQGFLEASAADVVRLAQGAQPEGLDLRLLLEYEVKPGGAVRVRLADRGALFAAMLREGLDLRGTNREEAERLYAALEGGARQCGAL